MTTEILAMIVKRREHKHKDNNNYKEINKNITKLIKEGNEIWMEKRCQELKNLQQKHNHFNMHKEITELTETKTKIHQQGHR